MERNQMSGGQRNHKHQFVYHNKPKFIRNYNNFMGGVNDTDQMLNRYLNNKNSLILEEGFI